MSKIKLLESSVYNKISAGEVVERPASVIKELIENSVDAGATRIEIEIENGGIDKIKITDNGCGIEKDDLVLAFKPHATSKISQIQDLDTLSTMGFRGEALASIAAVSQVEIKSKTQNQEFAHCLELQGGQVLSEQDVAGESGTEIVVSNLFFNVPARRKFLKKPKLEENEITNIVSRLMLAYSQISFRYVVNGEVVYLTSGQDIEEVLYVVYGKDILSNIYKVDFENHNIHIFGYIGKPIFVKSNRTYQTLIMNNRYIQNSNISVAVQKGYQNYLMKGKFPFYCLNLEIPSNSVDVNVHPQKTEVRFENDGQIFSAVYKAVQNVLLENREFASFSNFASQFGGLVSMETGEILQENAKTIQNNETTEQENRFQQNNDFNTIQFEDNKNDSNNSNKHITNEFDYETSEITNKLKNLHLNFEEKKSNIDENKISNYQILNSPNIDSLCVIKEQNKNIEKANINSLQVENCKENVEQDTFLSFDYKIVGCIFDTYILVEEGNNFIVIDQHAAHERILFEKLKSKIQNSSVQTHTLLVPYVFEVSSQDEGKLQELLPNLENIGFKVSEFGRFTYKIEEVPFDETMNFQPQKFVEDLLSSNYKSIDLKSNFNDILAQKACKSAVKGGNCLSENEIKHLLQEFIDSGTPNFCPHGRPIAIKFEKKDIEKWFKRII